MLDCVSPENALSTVEKAAKARKKATALLEQREREEAAAIQDAYEALGPGYGSATTIARTAGRSREHVRKVINPDFKRGHYAPTSSADAD